MLLKRPIFERLSDRPLAHCSTLAALPDGTLLAAWFAGSYETAPDVAILAAQRAPDQGGWTEPRVIAALPGRSLGQPVLLPRPNGDLWLFFDAIMERDWTSAQPFWQCSSDGGQTWQLPVQIMDRPGLMFRSRPLVLGERIILPVYQENTWQSSMLISDDDGRSWWLTDPLITEAGNIHPTVVRLSSGDLLAYLRTGGRGGVIWRTVSTDGGDTWSSPLPTSLPNPNSGLDLLRLQSGRLALAFNNSPTLRTLLCVALAGEDELWRWGQTLEDARAEFSYPTLLQTSDALIHLVYTYKREHIHYASFEESWLMEGKLNLD